MQKVEAYRASDGALFATLQLCQEHEVSLLWRARIDEYIGSKFCPYTKGTAQSNMTFKVVVSWEQFKEAHKADAAVDVDKNISTASKRPAPRNSRASSARPGR